MEDNTLYLASMIVIILSFSILLISSILLFKQPKKIKTEKTKEKPKFVRQSQPA